VPTGNELRENSFHWFASSLIQHDHCHHVLPSTDPGCAQSGWQLLLYHQIIAQWPDYLFHHASHDIIWSPLVFLDLA
jgi:hypothetical protein